MTPEPNTLEEMRTSCALHEARMNGFERDMQSVKGAVFGNGKVGLLMGLDRVEQRLDAISNTMAGIPALVEEKINTAILSLKPNLLDTDKVKLLIREELKADKKENENAPGSWAEFRKQWLFPIIMMIVSALVGAGLTYIVVSAP